MNGSNPRRSRWSPSLAELGAQRSELEVERARLASRIESLLDWEREREGLEAGAQTLFAGIEEGRAPIVRESLTGLLADHLATDTEHARALDAALGERAQAICVRATEDAARIVHWLKEERQGRGFARVADADRSAPGPKCFRPGGCGLAVR